ncbi:MAG TPA: signal peptide peptidase SppA [Tepidisphaeraceae bacterium]|nr:signal peptide peptidase SppA [Tepidisphaeraceae bacterium]
MNTDKATPIVCFPSVFIGVHRWLIVLCLALPGCGVPSFLITPIQNTNALQEVEAQPKQKGARGGGKIAMIEIDGMLINARSGGFLQPTENPLSVFTQQLAQAEQDPQVKAVVLRVNSPGGTVTTSDAMYEIVQRFRQKTGKPVVAALQEVAASGAYYVSCASDRIVAQPTTVVGSIGVIFNTFDFSGTMNKIGASSTAIKSGALKDMGSPFKPLSADERAVMQGMVNEYYARFVEVVKTTRPIKDPASLSTSTDGRVFSGQRALELGLVDELGLLEDAIDVARDLAKAPGAKAVMYKRPYGYRGSIYANSELPQPQANHNVTRLELPGGPWLPTGFYYLWNP